MGRLKMPYSESTKDLIDQLLKDKKVSWRKQREIKHAMSVGSELPSQRSPPPKPEPKAPTTFTMKTRSVARKETQEEIRARGGYDVDQYRPKPIVNREENIEKFQNKLTYGVEDPVKIYRQKKKEAKPEKLLIDFWNWKKKYPNVNNFLNEMTSIGQGQKYNA